MSYRAKISEKINGVDDLIVEINELIIDIQTHELYNIFNEFQEMVESLRKAKGHLQDAIEELIPFEE